MNTKSSLVGRLKNAAITGLAAGAIALSSYVPGINSNAYAQTNPNSQRYHEFVLPLDKVNGFSNPIVSGEFSCEYKGERFNIAQKAKPTEKGYNFSMPKSCETKNGEISLNVYALDKSNNKGKKIVGAYLFTNGKRELIADDLETERVTEPKYGKIKDIDSKQFAKNNPNPKKKNNHSKKNKRKHNSDEYSWEVFAFPSYRTDGSRWVSAGGVVEMSNPKYHLGAKFETKINGGDFTNVDNKVTEWERISIGPDTLQNRTDRIKTRRIGNLYMCYDEHAKSSDDDVLMAPRVAIMANWEANLALEILLGEDK